MLGRQLRQQVLKLAVLLLVLSGMNVSGPGTGTAHASGGRDAFSTIEAGMADQLHGSKIKTSATSLISINAGDWALYEDVDFGAAGAVDAVFFAAVPYVAEGNYIEIRVDEADGPLVGKLRLQGTAANYGNATEEAVALDATVTGEHDVYLVFVPNPDAASTQFCNLGWFKFNESYSRTDTLPPVTQAAAQGYYNGAYYTSEVTVTLAAYDDYRGVAATVYSTDEGATWQSYTGPIVFDREGSYELQYYSTDRAGNVEQTRSLPLNLENLGTRSAYSVIEAETADQLHGSKIRAPDTTLMGIGPGDWALYENIDFGMTGAVDAVFYAAVPYVAEGNYIEIRVDEADGPLVGKLRLQGTAANYGNATEEAVALDSAVTGVHDVYLVFVPNPDAATAQFCNLGWFKFNDSYSRTDTTPPVTQADVQGSFDGTAYTSAVTVTLSVYDDYRGVESTVYSLDGGTTWQDYETPILLKQEGQYALQYYSTDKAGNIEAAHALSLTLQDLPLPRLFWLSESMKPGDIAMIIGEHLDTVSTIELYRLPDDNVDQLAPAYTLHPQPDEPMTASSNPREVAPQWDEDHTVAIVPLQQTSQSLKFMIPSSETPGVYAIQPVMPGEETDAIYLNAPDLTWVQGDQGTAGTPGGWLRLTGHNLAAGAPQVVLEPTGAGEPVRLQASSILDEYSIQVNLPSNLAAGDYTVYAHNGQGGQTAWSRPVPIAIEAATLWPQTVFNVKDYGARGDGLFNDTAAVRDALYAAGQAGGGIVYFPGGRYHLTNTLEIPTFTTLRGESKELTQVFWSPFQWDAGELPNALVMGTHDFAIEDISFRATRVGNFIVSDYDTPDAGNVFIRRVRINADPFAGHDNLNTEQLINNEIWSLRSSKMDLLKLGGSNIQIVDSLLYGPNRPFMLVSPVGALVKGNTFYNGKYGWYSISGPDGLLFEDNEIIGADLTSTGGGISKPTNHVTQNVYFARNLFKNAVGNDREAMTNDGGSGAYVGSVASADGATLTLPDGGASASWLPHTWSGGGVFILSGTGAGQMREIIDHTKDTIQLDSPFEVAPDETSVISVTALQRDGFFVNNTFDNTGVFCFYGQAANMVVAGNTFRQAQGFRAWGRFVYGGNQPDWYIDVRGNTVEDGNYFHMYGVDDLWSGSSALKISSQGDYAMSIGTLVRDNVLKENSVIQIQGGTPQHSMRDVVVSGNTFADSRQGIGISGGVNGVVLYDNEFVRVTDELIVPQALLNNGKVTIVTDE